MSNPSIKEAGKATRFKPGRSGNPKGRPKGSRNWSTIVQELLADEQLADKLLANKPRWWDALPEKNGANAMIMAVLLKACDGDVNAFSALAKAGWGNNLVLPETEREEKPIYFIDLDPPELINPPKPKTKSGKE